MITPDWVVKNHHVGYWEEHEMTAFDQAWDLVKMPIHMEGEDEHPLSVHGPIYQGRRASNPDTGHWTPHMDKALAYALFGPRHDWGSQNYVDARTEIPEVYRYEVPEDKHIFIPPDLDYMTMEEHGPVTAADGRRVAFYDEYGDIQSGEYPGKEPTMIPDHELADIIERLLENKNFSESIGESYDSDGLTNYEGLMNVISLDTDFDQDEYKRIFNIDPVQQDNIVPNPDWIYSGDMQEALDEAYDGSIDIDLSPVTGMKGGHLSDIVRRLRERGRVE